MRDGRISQLGSPKAIYDDPADPFVADFIGSSNFLTGTAVSAGTEGEIAVRLDGGTTVNALARPNLEDGAKVVAAIRPERILVHASPGERRLEARVVERSYLGARTLYHLELGAVTLRAESPLALETSSVFIEIPAEGCITFPVEDSAR
jgi:iron(III) transport system ATP-binding protein